jgi:hypothetical protein
MISLPDGSLVKGAGPDVYVFDQGRLRAIPTPGTARALGFNLESIREIPEGELRAIPVGEPYPDLDPSAYAIRSARWLLFRGQIHLLEMGKRRPVPDSDTFDVLRLGRGEPTTVTPAELESIPLGTPYLSIHRLGGAHHLPRLIHSIGLAFVGVVGPLLAMKIVEELFREASDGDGPWGAANEAMRAGQMDEPILTELLEAVVGVIEPVVGGDFDVSAIVESTIKRSFRPSAADSDDDDGDDNS